MSKKTTKSALWMSALSLFLCFSMLIGTTFAWFTDEVTSDVNKIVAGNLDVELEYAKMVNGEITAWATVEGEDEIFNSDALWEPGRVEVVYLKVSNLGTLAMKYQLGVHVEKETPGVNMAGDEFYLSSHLVFKVVDVENEDGSMKVYSDREAVEAAAGAEQVLKDYNGQTTALEVGKTDYVALIVYMPETVDNDANYRGDAIPTIELGVKLYATQLANESDSFGPDYDEDATHEHFKVTTAGDLQTALNNGETNIQLENDIVAEEPIVIPAPAATTYAMRSSTVTIDLSGKTLKGSIVIEQGAEAQITNGRIQSVNSANSAIETVGTLTLYDVIITSARHAIRVEGGQVVIMSGSYHAGGTAGMTQHVLNVSDGGAVVIEGGTFVGPKGTGSDSGAAVNVQAGSIVTIQGGNFSGGLNSTLSAAGTLSVYGGIFDQDPTAFVGEGFAAAKTEEGYQVIPSGREIISDGVLLNTETGVYEIYSVAGLRWLATTVNSGNGFAGKTVLLMNDVDLANNEWVPIGTSSNTFKGIFDGNNKTISNLKISGNHSNVGLFGVTTDGEIKNLTIENASVSGYLNVGVVAGTPYTSKYTNITVTGHVEVNGFAYVGGVGGKNAYANWTGITVDVDETSYVKAISTAGDTHYRTYVGGVVGFNGEGGHTFKDITTNIDVIGDVCDIGGVFGIAHYNNKFENITCTGNVTGTFFDPESPEDADEIGGVAGVWHNENGTTVTFTNCNYTGKLTPADVSVDVSNNAIVGNAYTTSGNGVLIINGVEHVATATALQEKLNAATSTVTIGLAGDIAGDITVVQKPDVKVTIDGNGFEFNGVILVDGQSQRYETAALTIQNITFNADGISADACIRLGSGAGSVRYSNNVTVKNCTFVGNGMEKVAIKSYEGGDWNLTIQGCTVDSGMHSLAQLKNVEKGLKIAGCKIYSKNGVNVNNSPFMEMTGCTFDVQGYAVRFGSDNGSYERDFTISNSILKSACAEAGDAVIEIRAGAVNATLTLTNTTIDGAVELKGNTDATTIVRN